MWSADTYQRAIRFVAEIHAALATGHAMLADRLAAGSVRGAGRGLDSDAR